MSRPIPSSAVHYGLNADNVAWRDDRYVRCARCGFICHLDRDTHAPEGSMLGWGKNLVRDTLSYNEWVDYDNPTTYDGTNINRFDPEINRSTSGCPFCGCYMFDK